MHWIQTTKMVSHILHFFFLHFLNMEDTTSNMVVEFTWRPSGVFSWWWTRGVNRSGVRNTSSRCQRWSWLIPGWFGAYSKVICLLKMDHLKDWKCLKISCKFLEKQLGGLFNFVHPGHQYRHRSNFGLLARHVHPFSCRPGRCRFCLNLVAQNDSRHRQKLFVLGTTHCTVE